MTTTDKIMVLLFTLTSILISVDMFVIVSDRVTRLENAAGQLSSMVNRCDRQVALMAADGQAINMCQGKGALR